MVRFIEGGTRTRHQHGGVLAKLALSFVEIYAAWFDDVHRWVRLMGVAEADREDLVQDVFVVVHRRLAEFDGHNLAGWLYRITRRRGRDYKRLGWVRRLHPAGELSAMSTLLSPSRGPDDELEHVELERVLEGLIASLREEQRTAFVLFELEGWAGEAIALQQGVPLNTVWWRIRRARLMLRQGLLAHERRRA